jgi:hypothetical protein
VSTTEELLGRKSSGSGLEKREYGSRDPLRSPRNILYPQKLALTSLKSGGRSVGIVRSRSKATEFVCFVVVVCSSSAGAPLWDCSLSCADVLCTTLCSFVGV